MDAEVTTAAKRLQETQE